MTNKIIKCCICGKDHMAKYLLAIHLTKTHKDVISKQQYYDKYINSSEDKTCPYCCIKKRKFQNLSKGYFKTCCNKLCIDKQQKQTKLKIYGNENYNNMIKNEQTKLKKYGDENYNNRKKAKQTNLEKYGDENYNNRKQELQTKLNNIDENGLNSYDRATLKGKQTKLKKYGDENYNNSKKMKQTCLERHGADCTFQSDEIREKGRQTCLQRYGVDNYFKTEEFKKLWKDKKFLKKRNNKRYQIMKKNKSFNSSKKEIELLKILKQTYPDTIHQHKSVEYPFNCDFYIPSKDLYIELNLHWTHGTEAFDETKHEHIEKLKCWKLKSNKSDFYKNAIKVWTRSDPKKRKMAYKNNLNYVEIFKYDVNNTLKIIKKSINNQMLYMCVKKG